MINLSSVNSSMLEGVIQASQLLGCLQQFCLLLAKQIQCYLQQYKINKIDLLLSDS